MNDLNEKIAKIDTYFKSGDSESSEQTAFYQRIIKLTEEVGELNEAVLHEFDTNQRNKNKKISLDEEIADVIICALLLAESRKVNIWEIIDKKLEKQFDRFNLK